MPTPDQNRGTNPKKKKADLGGVSLGIPIGVPVGAAAGVSVRVEVKAKRAKAATKPKTSVAAKKAAGGETKGQPSATGGSRVAAGSRSRTPMSASARRAATVRAIPKTGLGEIERLRVWRPAPRGAGSIASEVEALTNMLQRNEVAAGGFARAWATLVPRDLQAVTRVERLHAGVLTVVAADASAKYDVEMWLLESGLSALRGVSARTLRRVKVVVA